MVPLSFLTGYIKVEINFVLMSVIFQVQCYKSAGYCWCVNEDTGKNIPGTSVKNGTPNCDHLKTNTRVMKGCPDDKKFIFLKDLLNFLHNKMSEITNGTNTRYGMLTYFYILNLEFGDRVLKTT